MTYITIDSRECGAGKTHGIGGIMDRIYENLSNNQKTIVSLPSIILMDEYKKKLHQAICIRSDVNDNVQKELHYAMNANASLIIITHKAFLDSEIPYSMREQYDLIIDEAIDPWKIHMIEQDKDDEVFDWNKFITKEKPLDEEDYTTVSFDGILTNSITRDSAILRNLTGYNWVNYAREDGLELLLKKERTRLNIISELDPMILTDWKSVHIAAAYFTKTFMFWWMRKHNIKFNEVNKFTPHKWMLKLHYPENGNGGWTWSRNKKSTMDWLQNAFYQYANEKIGNNKALRLKNKIDRAGMFEDEINLPHNTAGMNEWSKYKYVVLESSLNANPEMDKWYRQIIKDYLPDGTDVEQTIFAARTGYTYYQTLMRSCLRNGEEAEVFVIDKRAVSEIVDYFQLTRQTEKNIIEWVTKPVITNVEKKKKPLTGKERVQVNRLRKKYPEKYQGMTPREILTCNEKAKEVFR